MTEQATDFIIYEQPLHEVIRLCLRLEQLFMRLDYQRQDDSLYGTQVLMYLLNELLQILDRPDLKTKLAKELSLHHASLMRFANAPDIDQAKWTQLKTKLEEFMRLFIDTSGKIGHRLRDLELFNMLRLQFSNAGGACEFDLPVYHFWLEQDTEMRSDLIREWLGEFTHIRNAIDCLLHLLRENAKIQSKTATHGFYQELLDPRANLSLIRLSLNRDIKAFPEISIGRHFLSVRFYEPDIEKRPQQFNHHVQFELSYCMP